MKNQYKWMKTDTASIMFSSLSSRKWGRTFRMAAVFRDKEIDEEILRKAAADIMPRFPAMHTCIKKGFFWNYQQRTADLPEIRQENSRVLIPVSMRKDDRPDFRLVYYKRRIALETTHFLGDGKGATVYFDALLKRYVQLLDDPDSKYEITPIDEKELSNAYDEYYIPQGEVPEEKDVKAYRIPGKIEKNFLQLIFALADMQQICAKAKEKGMTVTELLTAALILGTLRNTDEAITEPIVIAVPVNLRRFFPTQSIRNFTIQTKITFMPQGRRDWSFDEICKAISGQMKHNTQPSELQKQLNKFGSLTHNPVLKIVPNFIKQPVIRMMQKKTHAGFTTILTNTGASELSPRLSEMLERVEGVNGDTSGYGLISTCSAVSSNNIFSLCFSVCSHDTSWPKECIRVLTQLGIDIRVESSHGNGEENHEM